MRVQANEVLWTEEDSINGQSKSHILDKDWEFVRVASNIFGKKKDKLRILF